MEENKKHPSQIIHGFLMADDRKQKEDVPILTHPLLLSQNGLPLFDKAALFSNNPALFRNTRALLKWRAFFMHRI